MAVSLRLLDSGAGGMLVHPSAPLVCHTCAMPPDTDNLTDDNILTRELRKALGPEREGLVDVFRRGADLEAYLQGNPQAKELARLAYDKVGAAAATMFDSPDITSKECIDAHFDGRVGMEIISWLNQVLVDGKTAEQVILAEDDMDEEQEQTE